MNLFVSRKLKALGYPKDITSMEVKIMSDIVCFLEDRIIRHYEIKERDSLRNEKNSRTRSIVIVEIWSVPCVYSNQRI